MTDRLLPGPRVFDEEDFRRLLAWEVQRATRYQDFLSLCLVRPGHPDDHDRGVLDRMADRVVDLLRATDVVGRVQDSIAILLVHTPDSDAALIAQRVRDLLEAALGSPDPGVVRLEPVLDLALASFPTDATSEMILLDQAQARLAEHRRGAHGSPPAP